MSRPPGSVGRIRSGAIHRAGLSSHVWAQILRGFEPYYWSHPLRQSLVEGPGAVDRLMSGPYWSALGRGVTHPPVAVPPATGSTCIWIDSIYRLG